MTFYRCICIFPRDSLVDGYVFIQFKRNVFIGIVGDVVQCESETLSDEGICENAQHNGNEEHSKSSLKCVRAFNRRTSKISYSNANFDLTRPKLL